MCVCVCVCVYRLFSHSVMANSATPWTAARQTSLSSTISWACSNSCQLVNDAIQPSHPVIDFSSCLQSFPASGSFVISWLFVSGGLSIGASAIVLLMNIEDWIPLGLTGLISLQFKRPSRVFNTTAQKSQFFSVQTSLSSNSHIHT